jgi:hypothetical protein
MNTHYPIVLIPDKLRSISSASPPLPPYPIKPEEPTLKEPICPTKPSEPASLASSWGCGFVIIAIFVLGLLLLGSSDLARAMFRDMAFPYGLIFLAAPFFAIYVIYIQNKTANHRQADYEIKLEKYENELKKYHYNKTHYKSKYEKELLDYESDSFPKYLAELKKYQIKTKDHFSKQHILAYRKTLVKEFFRNSLRPVQIETNYLKGVSEDYFFEFLKTKSSNFIRGFSIVENMENYRIYAPDIVYYDYSIGILIDIEIDEPYLGSDGTPIHYIGSDDKRNEFFRRNGWIVIRFAEEQIVKHPENCYAFIRDLIEKIETAKMDLDYNLIKPVPHWSKEMAHKMAFARIRHKYLSSYFIGNMEQEILDSKLKIKSFSIKEYAAMKGFTSISSTIQKNEKGYFVILANSRDVRENLYFSIDATFSLNVGDKALIIFQGPYRVWTYKTSNGKEAFEIIKDDNHNTSNLEKPKKFLPEDDVLPF